MLASQESRNSPIAGIGLSAPPPDWPKVSAGVVAAYIV